MNKMYDIADFAQELNNLITRNEILEDDNAEFERKLENLYQLINNQEVMICNLRDEIVFLEFENGGKKDKEG